MIQMLPLISAKLKMQESVSVQQQNLENDSKLLESVLGKLKDHETYSRLKTLLQDVDNKIDYFVENPNHYE